MIETCFGFLEYYLKQIKNSEETYVFEESRRLVREKPDFDFIIANVSENNPYCLVNIADYRETPLGFLFNTYCEYEITDVAHTGTGTATYQVAGDHKGNNTYVLKISTGGTIGVEPYPQYQLKVNEDPYSDPADIPADGKIAIGDGTTFEFEVNGEVVTDDTYEWQTIAKRVNVTKEKEIELKLRTEIWAKTKKELFETGGYFDQLSQLAIERYVTDGVQVIYQSPGPSRWIQSRFETENNLIRGALEVSYRGSIFSIKEDALVCELIMS